MVGLERDRGGDDRADLAGPGLSKARLARAGGERAGAGKTEQPGNRFQMSA